jgi:hypothetical protein
LVRRTSSWVSRSSNFVLGAYRLAITTVPLQVALPRHWPKSRLSEGLIYALVAE